MSKKRRQVCVCARWRESGAKKGGGKLVEAMAVGGGQMKVFK